MSESKGLTITETLKPETVERVILGGDLGRLTSSEKLEYYSNVCRSLGLNPLTQPFAYLKLNGKEVLYAKRDCTDQLRRVHQVSIKITAREQIGGLYVVTAQATTPDGRCDESTGAVPIEGIKGDALANAFLKSETKAKRRATLSICGLGLLDESEVDSIPDVEVVSTKAIKDNPAEDGIRAAREDARASDPGEFVINFGKKYKGKKIKDIDPIELEGFINWCEGQASLKGMPLSDEARFLKVNFARYLDLKKKEHEPPAGRSDLSEEEEMMVERMIDDDRMRNGSFGPGRWESDNTRYE